MKIKFINKALLITALALSLNACTNQNTANTSPQPAVAAENNNQNDTTVEVTEKDAPENTPEAGEKTANEDKSQTTTIEVNKAEEAASTEAKSKEESVDTQTMENTANTDYTTADGSYTVTLRTDLNGDRDKEYTYATAKDVRSEDGTLVVEGTLDYLENPDNAGNVNELENQIYKFKIDENTEFLSGGGLAEPEYYTLDEFIKFYNEVKDSGLGLSIEVENGIVKQVGIFS